MNFDVLRRRPVPATVDPRTYVSLNRLEQVLEENHFDHAVRCFRAYWREQVIDISEPTSERFRTEVLRRLSGSRLYGPWWMPGGVPRSMTSALRVVRRTLEHMDLKEIFE